MIPSFGGGEHWLMVAVVLLLVVRPKDLPKTLREIGRWVGKVRSMANEFKASFEDMARQSELDELRAEVEAMRTGKPMTDVQAALDASQVEVDAMVNGDIPYQPDSVLQPYPMEALAEADPTPKPRKVRKPKAETVASTVPAVTAAKPAPRRRAAPKARS